MRIAHIGPLSRENQTSGNPLEARAQFTQKNIETIANIYVADIAAYGYECMVSYEME